MGNSFSNVSRNDGLFLVFGALRINRSKADSRRGAKNAEEIFFAFSLLTLCALREYDFIFYLLSDHQEKQDNIGVKPMLSTPDLLIRLCSPQRHG